jgi:hypothetical protein
MLIPTASGAMPIETWEIIAKRLRPQSRRRPPPAAARGEATAPHGQKPKAFNNVDSYAECPQVADAVIKALLELMHVLQSE